LHIYGLDLRDIVGVEAFVTFVAKRYGKIDILVNNACQTIRRPASYYTPLVEDEQTLFRSQQHNANFRALLNGCMKFEDYRRTLHLNQQDQQNQYPQITPSPQAESESMIDTNTSFRDTGLSTSAHSSQLILLNSDSNPNTSQSQIRDINAQPVDLRKENSWLLQIQDISTPEVLETFLINTIAPFVLNSRIVTLMQRRPEDDKYIINVSAMEGKFYRYKMPNHPHTNMAKAALNMMTRTSSEELARKHRIYMNSVDTGWINDENPLERAAKIAKTNNFQTPIDEIDAASRILDPIFNGKKEYGIFFKDYRETEW